jgi:hypothetical protein
MSCNIKGNDPDIVNYVSGYVSRYYSSLSYLNGVKCSLEKLESIKPSLADTPFYEQCHRNVLDQYEKAAKQLKEDAEILAKKTNHDSRRLYRVHKSISSSSISFLRKLEETTRILHQRHASPEKPFSIWQTIGMTPFALQINPQMTLFVDPLNLSSVFQRVNSALVQETSASQEGLSASIGRAIAIVSSTEAHTITKYVGIFLKNTLLTIERLNGNSRHSFLTEKSFSEAWETETMPAIHRSIDRAYRTNVGTNYTPNNDGRVQQTLQGFFLDPLWLVPLGPLVEGLNLTIRGATVTIKEIGSAMKTARVALESPLAMKPAFAIAGSSAIAKETKAIEGAGVILSELKAGSRAANVESKVTSSGQLTVSRSTPNHHNAVYNRVKFEEYKTKLRREMEKPSVTDPELRTEVDKYYRPDAIIGSGSTAAAIRYERETGELLRDTLHSKKGADAIRFLEKWLKKNPTASSGDRAAAENILLDLKDALGQ